MQALRSSASAPGTRVAAGADDAVTILLARHPAEHTPLDDPHGVATLLDSLRAAGADDAVSVFRVRLKSRQLRVHLRDAPASEAEGFRYGREPDETPSAQWDWTNVP